MSPTTGKRSEPPDSPSGRRDLARIGALVSDQARCQMLLALGDGRALPAGVLAAEAGVIAHHGLVPVLEGQDPLLDVLRAVSVGLLDLDD